MLNNIADSYEQYCSISNNIVQSCFQQPSDKFCLCTLYTTVHLFRETMSAQSGHSLVQTKLTRWPNILHFVTHFVYILLLTSSPKTSDCSEDSVSSSVFTINVTNNFALPSPPAYRNKMRKQRWKLVGKKWNQRNHTWKQCFVVS